MRILVYGNREDYQTMVQELDAVADWQYRTLELIHAECYERFAMLLLQTEIALVIVAMNGAEGMEGVIAAKRLCPNVQVMWFSDDACFGAQSHRLECAYFGQKPITGTMLSAALRSYHRERQEC